MTEEEIIKEIEIIKEAQDIMEHNLDIYPPKEDIYRLDTKQLKAVICLLDLYNKQKEEIKELNSEFAINTEIHKRDEEIKELKDIIKCLHEPSENYISKDKIREKIKELECYGDYIRYRFVYTDYDKQVNKAKIEVLKDLIEED